MWQVCLAAFEDRTGHSQGLGAPLEARRGTKTPSAPRWERSPANALDLAR